MTEFEMAYLSNDMLVGVGAGASYYFATLTAFLVASYLVANRLTRAMAFIVVGLFLVFQLSTLGGMFRTLQSLAGLAREMKAFAQAGKGLAWHRAATAPDWAFDLPRYLMLVVFTLATFAAVYFFFLCRRQKAAGEQSPPQVAATPPAAGDQQSLPA